MNSDKFGEFIRNKRKEKGLTQQQLGDIVGVSMKAVSKWECGNAMPDVGTIKKLSETLGVSTDELLEGKCNNKENNVSKKIKPIIIVIVLGIILLVGTIYLLLNNKKENNKLPDKYDCTLIKTYRINDIYASNDENYLYVTFSQYQTEGVYTIKLPRSISGSFEKGKNYEFTFMINKMYVNDSPEVVFNNSEVLNVEATDKIGMAQMNRCDCE